MKYIEQYLIDERKIKALGQITFEDEIRYDLSGVNVLIDGKDVDIFVSHVDYLNWIESLTNEDQMRQYFHDKNRHNCI